MCNHFVGEKDISLKEGMWRNEKTVRLSAAICGCGGAFAAAIADNALRWLRARAAAGGAGALWSGRSCALGYGAGGICGRGGGGGNACRLSGGGTQGASGCGKNLSGAADAGGRKQGCAL